MKDLSARLFYKTRFILQAEQEGLDLQWELIMYLRRWIVRKLNRYPHTVVSPDLPLWSRFKTGGKLYDLEDTNTFYAESAQHLDRKTGLISWACKIVEKPAPSPDCAPREWVTEVGLQQQPDGSAQVSYVVTYSDQAGFIGDCEPEPAISVPNVIKRLFSDQRFSCRVGADRLSLEPTKLRAGDYPAFEKLLFDPARALPLLYISPGQTDPEGPPAPLLDPRAAAEAVAGNALVYYSEDPGFTGEMHYMGHPGYQCHGGALRLFQPGADAQDPADRYRHRFIRPKTLLEQGSGGVLTMLRRALAQDVHYYDQMFRLENCQELLRAAVREATETRLLEESSSAEQEALAAYLEESEARRLLEEQCLDLMQQLEERDRDIASLQSQLLHMGNRAVQGARLSDALVKLRAVNQLPNTPERIARYFEDLYPDRLVFSPRGRQSLKDCITRPDVLWDALYHMANQLHGLLVSKPATAYKEFKEQTGWDCSRGEGKMTRSDAKLMRQYTDLYNGREIDIEAHVKAGVKDHDPRSVRIYFAYDPDVAPQIIIGHCGSHLDNYSTKKIR